MIQVWGNASKIDKVSKSRGKQRYWTDNEKIELKNLIDSGYSIKEMSLKLKRTNSAIQAMIHKLGLGKSQEWSKEDESFLVSNYRKMTYKEISEKLCKSFNSVNCKIYRMGLRENE